MRLFAMAFLAACDQDTNVAPTDSVNEDSGWENYDADSDTDSDGDTDTDVDSGDTDTAGDTGRQHTPCQEALMGTDPAYPVYPYWEADRVSVNFTVTLTGATKPWATVSWGGTNPDDWGWIACANVVEGSTAVITVEAMGVYQASTFGNADPGDGSVAEQNGFYWYPWSVTGGDLGGTQYFVQVDGETVNLVAVEQPAQ